MYSRRMRLYSASLKALSPMLFCVAALAPVTRVIGVMFADVVSGQFDADEASPEVVLPKRVLGAQADTPKLHKVLAQSGLGSRLEMEQLITQGRI